MKRKNLTKLEEKCKREKARSVKYKGFLLEEGRHKKDSKYRCDCKICLSTNIDNR